MHYTKFRTIKSQDNVQMAEIDNSLTFTVRRHAPELIIPEKSTPRELKPLSDIDDQEVLRFQAPLIFFYHRDTKMRSKNPASVIREALPKQLVFYYPFAGRIKEGPTGKLMVDCSSRRVLFIEAEADVTLDQFGDQLQPPFPCIEELLYDVHGSGGILDSPLLLIQVTRLRCGGFILAIRFNHTMSDAAGLVQFLYGLGEIARGAASPSILPVWQRELLCSSDQLPIYHTKLQVAHANNELVHKSLFFTSTDISAFRRLVPVHQQSCSTFEVLTAFLWRCRTIALQPDPEEEMPIIWPVNARNKFNPRIPVGYYGNVLAFLTTISTAQDLCNKPLGYALDLVMKTKFNVDKRYIRSASDLMEIKLRPHFLTSRSFIVSDLTCARLDAMDYGWGKAVYGGHAKGGGGVIPGITSLYVPYTNNKGESGIVIPISLPSEAMNRFLKEVNNMLAHGNKDMEHESPVISKL